jgi:hypothetical protein
MSKIGAQVKEKQGICYMIYRGWAFSLRKIEWGECTIRKKPSSSWHALMTLPNHSVDAMDFRRARVDKIDKDAWLLKQNISYNN